MKHLFIIRHGYYDRKKNLSKYGIKQIKTLASNMKSIIGDSQSSHYLLSSTAPRAIQTADIIAKTFRINVNKEEFLYTSGGDDLSLSKLEEIDFLIDLYKNNESITLVTHYEVVNSYPKHFVKTMFNEDKKIIQPNKGEGIYLSLESRTHQLLPAREYRVIQALE